MSKIYDALNEVGANPFEPSNAPLPDGIIRGTATGLRKELVEFEKLLDERVGRLRLAAAEADTAATNDSQQAARTIEKLNGEISALDTKLKETRDLLERKVVASQALERELTATVSELKNRGKIQGRNFGKPGFRSKRAYRRSESLARRHTGNGVGL